MRLTNDKELQVIEDFILLELMKRGFNVKMESIEEVENSRGSHRIEFKTTSFQTQPVIFKDTHVANFSSSITENELNPERKDILKDLSLFIDVSVRTKQFEGGNNGASLFTIKGKIKELDRSGWTESHVMLHTENQTTTTV